MPLRPRQLDAVAIIRWSLVDGDYTLLAAVSQRPLGGRDVLPGGQARFRGAKQRPISASSRAANRPRGWTVVR